MTRVITFGTFDLFHIGHLNILTRARHYGDYLLVGVSSDALNMSKKDEHHTAPLARLNHPDPQGDWVTTSYLTTARQAAERTLEQWAAAGCRRSALGRRCTNWPI